jgi:hypothetical protein
VRWTSAGNGESTASAVSDFMTQRAKGSTFTFGVQGDSHPERAGKMFNAGLYRETLGQVAAGNLDFHIALGDDFSVDRLIERNQVNATSVARIYEDQRNYLAVAGHTVPIFLVNGNHEQAGRWMLDGTPDNIAAIAGRTRTKFFSLPAPDHFYTGDPEVVEHVGLLRDYYAWTWGDALFVVLDAYWHSKVPVDHEVTGRRQRGDDAPRGGGRQRDLLGSFDRRRAVRVVQEDARGFERSLQVRLLSSRPRDGARRRRAGRSLRVGRQGSPGARSVRREASDVGIADPPIGWRNTASASFSKRTTTSTACRRKTASSISRRRIPPTTPTRPSTRRRTRRA